MPKGKTNKNGAAAWGNKLCPACGNPVRRTQSHSSLPPPMMHFTCRYPLPPRQLRLGLRP